MDNLENHHLIPAQLINKILSGRCVLFLGAGASVESGIPKAEELTYELSEKFLEGRHKDEPLSRVASYIEHKTGVGRGELIKYIVDRISKFSPNKGHFELVKYPWTAIYTTNYDDLVERVFNVPSSGSRLVKIVKSTDLSVQIQTETETRTHLYKLHGCITNPSNKEVPLIISEDDYVTARKNKVALLRRLEVHKYTNTFLFAGYSFGDSDLWKIWQEVSSELEDWLQWSYAIWPGCTYEQKELWRDRRVHLIDCTFSHFFSELAKFQEPKIDAEPEYVSAETLSALLKLLSIIIDTRDTRVFTRNEKLVIIVELLGKELELTDKQISLLKTSALALDIGIIAVSDKILYKLNPLTVAEYEAIKNLPVISERILSSIPGMKEVSKVIRSYYEHYDGSGFPDRLSGNSIPIESRVLQIAASFFAMLSDRPYRNALTIEEAKSELYNNAGKQFDPKVINALLSIIADHRINEAL